MTQPAGATMGDCPDCCECEDCADRAREAAEAAYYLATDEAAAERAVIHPPNPEPGADDGFPW